MKILSTKATATKEKIITTAHDLFYEHGYHATGIDAIIKSAGVTKGNFYYYFKSKELLALDVLDWHFEKIQMDTSAAVAQKSLTAKEALFTTLEVIESRNQTQHAKGTISGCFFGNFTLEMSAESTVIQNKLEEIFSHLKETLKQLIVKAQETGEIRSDLDAEIESQMILTMMEGALLLDKAKQKPLVLKQTIEFLRTHLAN